VPYLAQQPAGAVVDGLIHFCGGGYPNTGTPLNDHYYYHPDSNQWFLATDMPAPTAIHEAVGFDGKLYVLSGQPDKTLCEYYNPTDSFWHIRNALPDQHFWYSAIVNSNNAIYRFGGGGFTAPQSLAHKYETLNDSWIPVTPLPMPRHAIAGTALDDWLVILSGGYSSGTESSDVWIYNTYHDTYLPSDPLPVARSYHAMVTIDSCVYSVGGYNGTVAGLGVSLIRNCAVDVLSAVPSPDLTRPYQVIVTPQTFFLGFGDPRGAGLRMLDMSGRIMAEARGSANVILDGRAFPSAAYVVLVTTPEGSFVERWLNLAP
jgi:N-acetylneuraminic acid mutarotase